MVERFQYEKDAEYPGKATLIFYKNGAALELDQDGMPALRSSKPQDTPYYMEAEINSPIVRLQPGDSYSMDTRWFPTRAASQLKTVTDVAVINKPLAASLDANSLLLSGSFGVFFPGELIVHGFNPRGIETDAVPLLRVDPANSVELQQQVRLSPNAVRISVHLVDDAGVDRGTVGEALISKTEKSS
jgi:hypothetical protein